MNGHHITRYSTAFRRKVIGEIETGKLTLAEARNIYGIRGSTTIQRWMVKFGKNHLLNRVVRIEMKDEKDKVREQREKIRQLESALSDAHLHIIVLRSTIDELESLHGATEKKTTARDH